MLCSWPEWVLFLFLPPVRLTQVTAFSNRLVRALLSTSLFSTFLLRRAGITSKSSPLSLSLMASQQTGVTPLPKRRKLDDVASNQEVAEPAVHASLNKPISPPLSCRKSPELPSFTPTWNFDSIPEQTLASRPAGLTTNQPPDNESSRREETRFLPSPIQLTKIEKLSAHQNVDAVSLSDLLGDPLIKECWNFNFLFDLDFVM